MRIYYVKTIVRVITDARPEADRVAVAMANAAESASATVLKQTVSLDTGEGKE